MAQQSTKGDGRVFKRGNVWWCAFYHRGKEYRESGGPTERAAREVLRQRLAEVRLDVYKPVSKRLTLAELIDARQTSRALGGKPVSVWLKSVLKRVKDELGDWRVKDVTTLRLEVWARDRITAGYKPGTVKTWLSFVATALENGRRLGLTQARPDMPRITLDNVRRGFFEAREFAAVLPHLPAPIADVATFAYHSGWRRGEILGLTWGEVDRGAGLITLPGGRTKTGKGRVLPLVGELGELLERRWKARAIGSRIVPWVFHRDGERIRRFEMAWQVACVEAGVPGRIFHDLRRTAVRDMVRAGASRNSAKQVSGHRSDAVFDRYDITDHRDQAAALALLQAYRAKMLTDKPGGQRPIVRDANGGGSSS